MQKYTLSILNGFCSKQLKVWLKAYPFQTDMRCDWLVSSLGQSVSIYRMLETSTYETHSSSDSGACSQTWTVGNFKSRCWARVAVRRLISNLSLISPLCENLQRGTFIGKPHTQNAVNEEVITYASYDHISHFLLVFSYCNTVFCNCIVVQNTTLRH